MGWFSKLRRMFRLGRTPKVSAVKSEPTPAAGKVRPQLVKPQALHALPRFHSSASDRPDVGEVDRFGKVRLKLRTAYTPSQPVMDPRMFAGRTALLAKIIRAIEDQRLHTIVYGERGIGKTSLLQVLIRMAREARYLVAYVSCGAAASFDDTFRTIAAEIPLLFHEDYGPTSAEGESGKTMADLLPSEEVSPRLASEFCAKVIGTRVLVVMDEFDRSRSSEFRQDMAEFLKNLSDRSVRVQLVIAGVAANLDDLLEPGEMLQRNVIAIEVPQMTDQEIEQLVEIGQDISGLTFDEGAVSNLKWASKGLPYVASLLSQRAGLVALANQRMMVTSADVEEAIDQALGEIDGRLPRQTRASVVGWVRDGFLPVLGPLAGRAIATGGAFAPSEVPSIFPDAEQAKRAVAEIDRLTAQGILISQTGPRLGQHLQFADRNGLLYLWLLGVHSQLRDAKTPATLANAL